MIKKAQELFECTQTSTDSHVLLHENGIQYELGVPLGLVGSLFLLSPFPASTSALHCPVWGRDS